MKNFSENLKKCPLFLGIEEESLNRMLACLGAKVEHFDRKQTIFAEGEEAKDIGILLSGGAQEIRIDYYGNRSILSDIAPSEVFGEAFACAEIGELPVSVVATEPSDVMFVDCSHILHTCHNNCGFHQQQIFNLMKILAEKNLRLY